MTACPSPPPPPAAAPSPPATVAALIDGLRREHEALQTLHDHGPRAAAALGAVNGKLLASGYFRRIPAQPATDGLRSQLRALALRSSLVAVAVDCDVADLPSPVTVTIAAGQDWRLDPDDLVGEVHVRIALRGRDSDIAAFVDAVPSHVDRLVQVRGGARTQDGAILDAVAWFERPWPYPEVRFAWPGVDERLAAAGIDPRAAAADPAFADLTQQVDLGLRRKDEVLRLLQVTADFGRWRARWQAFEAKSRQVRAVGGAGVVAALRSGSPR